MSLLQRWFHRKYTVYVLAALFYLLVAVVFTWPLVTRMGNSLLGQIGDNIYFVWMIGWIKRALFELHVNPFNVWFLNYPEGWNMAYTEITPAMILLALPFSFIGGPTFAYNSAMLAAFCLSGLAMFIWVRRLTKRSDASLVAGLIFAALPFRMAHLLIGHLNLSGTMWLPLYFMGFLELLTGKLAPKPAGRWGVQWGSILTAGIFLGLTALTSQYYFYMACILSGLIALVYLVFFDRARLGSGSFWKSIVAAGIIALPLIVAGVAPYIALNRAGGLPDRNLSIVRMYSASPTDFLLPSTDHFLWGQWIGSHFNREMWIEGTLYVGAVSIVLAILAFIKRKQIPNGWLISLMLWGAGFAALLAMGTDLHWNGQSVVLHTPGFLKSLVHRDELPLLLPGYFLFLYFPFFAKLRALMRFGVFVLVFSSAMAGMGCAWLFQKINQPLDLRKRSSWAPVMVVALLGLVFIDFYPGPYSQFAKVEARPVDYWLAAQPGNGAVIQFPFIKGEDQDQTYNTLVNGKPFVGGFFNAFPPAQYSRIKPIMANFPDSASVKMLPELGVQYVLVDQRDYQDIQSVRKAAEALGLRFVTQIGDNLVFEPGK
jgi:hypothetical protein